MKLFQSGELRLLWPFYLDAIISPMLYFMPIFFVLYFQGLGLSLTKISILVAIMPLFSLIFEVPTGAFADLYGRKASVLMSFFLAAIGYGLLAFFRDFFMLILVFAFIGFAVTFSSGAREAWVVDLLKNRKGLFANYTAKMQAFDAFGLVVSGLIGAVFVKAFGIAVIWPVTTLSFLLSLLILLFAREKRIRTDAHIAHTMRELGAQAKVSLRFCYRKTALFKLLIANSILLFALNFGSILSWTPFLMGVGLPDYALGYLWSLLSMAPLLAAIASHVFLKSGKERAFIITSTIISAVVAFSVLFVYNLAFAILVLGLQFFFIDVMRPAYRVYFHSFIPSQLRATIGSVEGMLLSLVGSVSLPLVGLLVDAIGARYTIFLTSILLIPVLMIYFSIKETK